MIENNNILSSECNFDEVENVNSNKFECSPKLPNSFEGLLINAPSHVVWPKGVSLSEYPAKLWGITKGPLRLMMAGTAYLRTSTHDYPGEISRYVLIVAVNQATGKPYCGRMPQTNIDFPSNLQTHKQTQPVGLNALLGETEQSTSLPADHFQRAHFNFDLVHDLNIPIADATYHVYACLAGYTSNVATIKASVEK